MIAILPAAVVVDPAQTPDYGTLNPFRQLALLGVINFGN